MHCLTETGIAFFMRTYVCTHAQCLRGRVFIMQSGFQICINNAYLVHSKQILHCAVATFKCFAHAGEVFLVWVWFGFFLVLKSIIPQCELISCQRLFLNASLTLLYATSSKKSVLNVSLNSFMFMEQKVGLLFLLNLLLC